MTGLTDFGADDYSDGLAVILESYARDADLTQLGQKVARVGLRGALGARLLSEAAWAAHPRYAGVPVDRPIFVTGLPRSGTTALHRLLTADPGHQGLQLWLAELPQPRPPRDTWAANPAFQHIQAGYQQHHVEHPEFMGVHYIAADTVEECWQLLRQTLRSVSYECLAHLPTYSAWLRSQDWTGTVPAAQGESAAHRLERCRQAVGAEESQPPVHAGRDPGGVPGRADHPDAQGAADGDRVNVQPGRARYRRLVADLPRPGHRRRSAGTMGPRARRVRCGQGQVQPRAVPRCRLRGFHRRPGRPRWSRCMRILGWSTQQRRRTPSAACTRRRRTATAGQRISTRLPISG